MEVQNNKYGSEEQLQALPPLLVHFNAAGSEERGDGRSWNPQLERRIRRKFDLHILPWVFLLWLLAFLDRSNIGTH